MPSHRIHIGSDQPLIAGTLEVGGEEAHHAVRVKRVAAGQMVEVLDGRGHIGSGRISAIEKDRGSWKLMVEVASVVGAERVSPRVEVLSAAPKGPRLSELIDGLSQAGAASWAPLETERGVVEPGALRVERLVRIAAEASKQSGRAWHLEIGNPQAFEGAVVSDGGARVVLANATGSPYRVSGAPIVRVLIGPEGGWTASEVAAARLAGVVFASFGPHAMRIETAAVVAAAIVLDRERAHRDAPNHS